VSEKEPSGSATRRGHDYISLFVDMARRKVVYVADGKDAATAEEFADFLEAHGGKREAVTDASIDMGAAFEAGIKENFPNAEITFDKFHVVKLANNRRSGRPCLSDGKAIALEHSGGSFIARHLVQAGKPASRAFALSRLRSLLASASVLDVASWTAQPVEAVGVGSTPWRAREDRAPNRSPKAPTKRLRDCRLSAALRQSQRTEEARRCGDGDARHAGRSQALRPYRRARLLQLRKVRGGGLSRGAGGMYARARCARLGHDADKSRQCASLEQRLNDEADNILHIPGCRQARSPILKTGS
jgi:hypothetical protein